MIEQITNVIEDFERYKKAKRDAKMLIIDARYIVYDSVDDGSLRRKGGMKFIE